MACVFGSLLFIVGFGPRTEHDRQAGPFDQGLTEKTRGVPAPMDPGSTAALFCDRGYPEVALHGSSIRENVPLGTKGSQDPGSQRGTSAWQLREKVLFRML